MKPVEDSENPNTGLAEPCNILLEMRPALEGFAGIPQEVRLLALGLQSISGVRIEGLIQHPARFLARGLPVDPAKSSRLTPLKRSKRLADVVISLTDSPPQRRIRKWFRLLRTGLQTLVGVPKMRTTRLPGGEVADFIWRTLYDRSLSAGDRMSVSTLDYRILSTPWQTLQHVSHAIRTLLRVNVFPALDTSGFDVFIAQTPYPASPTEETKFVIRYHDALPVLMPHVVSNKRWHLTSHYFALQKNVRAGAHFACVSEATRSALTKLFPELETRSITIPNMIAPAYFLPNTNPRRVPKILQTRWLDDDGWRPSASRAKMAVSPMAPGLSGGIDYLLSVSTIEPRKNHLRLVSAWERLRDTHPKLKLVIVGTLGWDNEEVRQAVKPWIDEGQIYMLHRVPPRDLSVLYRYAQAVVCPSLEEGFDFSGAEAQAAGGRVAASDIPVHREIYGHASTYFDPYSTEAAAFAISRLLLERGKEREARIKAGQQNALRYTPDVVLPQWARFLGELTAT